MDIVNAAGTLTCTTKQELENLIRNSAQNPFDEIWISETDTRYPCLAVLVNGNCACIHYFPDDEDIWQSVGDSEQEVLFQVTGEAPSMMPGNCVISLETAIRCVNEFFDTHQRPECIRWRDL